SDARMTASLVLVRWEYLETGVEAQQSLKQTLMQSLGITARQIGAPGRADEQRIAREYPVLDHEAHGVPRVPRGVKHAQPEPSQRHHFPVVEPHVDKRRTTFAMH